MTQKRLGVRWGYIYRLERQEIERVLDFWMISDHQMSCSKILAWRKSSLNNFLFFLLKMAYFFWFCFFLFLFSLLFSKGYMSLSQVVKRTRNKLAPWENSCSSSEAVLPWLFSMKLSRMWLLAAFPALSQSCKKLKSRLIAACSFIEIIFNQSWS